MSTTADTGSETSWAYVITGTTTDPDNPHEYVASDDHSVTTLAIDDPVGAVRVCARLLIPGGFPCDHGELAVGAQAVRWHLSCRATTRSTSTGSRGRRV